MRADPVASPHAQQLLCWATTFVQLPRHLAILLEAAIPVPAGNPPAASHVVPAAEALATTLTSRAIEAAGTMSDDLGPVLQH